MCKNLGGYISVTKVEATGETPSSKDISIEYRPATSGYLIPLKGSIYYVSILSWLVPETISTAKIVI